MEVFLIDLQNIEITSSKRIPGKKKPDYLLVKILMSSCRSVCNNTSNCVILNITNNSN